MAWSLIPAGNGGVSWTGWWSTLNWQYTTSTSATTQWIIPSFSDTTNTAVYGNWNGTWPLIVQGTSTPLNDLAWQVRNAAYTETAEQRALRERQQAEYAAQAERDRAAARGRMAVRERERAAADELAGNLLLACLSPVQAADHLQRGWFDVISSRGRRFRVYTSTGADGWGAGQAGNVVLLDAEGRRQARYCVHPPDGLPHADAWLAQKLALEADEDSVMAVANMPWAGAGHRDIRGEARQRHLRAVA